MNFTRGWKWVNRKIIFSIMLFFSFLTVSLNCSATIDIYGSYRLSGENYLYRTDIDSEELLQSQFKNLLFLNIDLDRFQTSSAVMKLNYILPFEGDMNVDEKGNNQ